VSIWHAAAVLEGDRVFRLEERFEPDGTLRLMLIGELDVAAIDHLSVRLREFIDSSGIQELIREVTDARRDRWALDVDGPMTEPVARTVDLVGARSFFWPDEG